jgi:hypothetical protein
VSIYFPVHCCAGGPGGPPRVMSGRMMPFGCQGDMAGRGRRMGVWVGSNRGRPKMTGGPNLGHPHAWAPGASARAPFAGLNVGAVRDGMPQARGSDDTSRGASVADPACRFYRCGPTRAGGLPRPTCAASLAPRQHRACTRLSFRARVARQRRPRCSLARSTRSTAALKPSRPDAGH